MNAGRKAHALAFAAALAVAALAPAARAQTPQTDPPRRPRGPVAGPAIKLPPGSGAQEERTQQPSGAKEAAARGGWEAQRWEYCVIRGFRLHQKGFSFTQPVYAPAAYVRYFPEGSEEVEGANEEEALANAFAKLGEEGWELTAVRTDFALSDGNGASSATYFFKRPKAPGATEAARPANP
ncbi:MAG TPA: hypothetical protein VF736_03740 [Pyrinomonadaceae bacterium]|jgi:hypothetical protein